MRLSRPWRGLAVLAVVLCGLAEAGCSYRLASMIADQDVGPTGSVNHPGDRTASTATAQPSEFDLAYARAVASDVLARGSKDTSVPWENPETGAGGNITPLAAAYTEDGVSCRDFLASYVHGRSEAWLQGAACRTSHGKWEVKSLKPFKRS